MLTMNRSFLRLLILVLLLAPISVYPAGAQDKGKDLNEQVKKLEDKVLRLENEILAIRVQREAGLGETP